MQRNKISRRRVLAVAATTPSVAFAGCNTTAPEDDAEYSCPDPFPVKVYNETEETRSIALTIRDGDADVLFSDTIELSAETGPYGGTDLDVEIYDARRYTFEITADDDTSINETFEATCGPVFVFIDQTGEPMIRDDELDHLREA